MIVDRLFSNSLNEIRRRSKSIVKVYVVEGKVRSKVFYFDRFRCDFRGAVQNSTSFDVFGDDDFEFSFLVRSSINVRWENFVEEKENFVRFLEKFCSSNSEEKELWRDFSTSNLTPIGWLTRESFVRSLVERALTKNRLEILLDLSFFFVDVREQIETIFYQNQIDSNCQEEIFYRFQHFDQENFLKLVGATSKLISFRNFLFATDNLTFVQNQIEILQPEPNFASLLFRIFPRAKSSRPFFAKINQFDFFRRQENLILFSLDAVFHLIDIQPIGKRTFRADLRLVDEHDTKFKNFKSKIESKFSFSDPRLQLLQFLIDENRLNDASNIFHRFVRLNSFTDPHQINFLTEVFQKLMKNSSQTSILSSTLQLHSSTTIPGFVELFPVSFFHR